MKTYKSLSFSAKIRWRNRFLLLLLLFMLAYMILIGELDFGDSRIMSDLASTVSRIIFFGGMIWVLFKIAKNKKTLRNRLLLQEKLKEEFDEHNQYLYDKSGGIVWDLMLACLLFATLTTALINMPAFYTALSLLLAAVLFKLAAYLFYRGHVN